MKQTLKRSYPRITTLIGCQAATAHDPKRRATPGREKTHQIRGRKKKKMQNAEVWSCDVSPAALEVAKRNAATIGTDINLIQLDFLDKGKWGQLPSFDIIISNPPYVPEKDKQQMHNNVLNYEPAAALFVPDNDPLVFYKAIAEFGKTHLNKNGSIYTEIHENLGEATMTIFQTAGYITELKKDMQQKDRMIKSGLV